MLSRRLQILIDEGRYARLAERAGKRGVSVASVIREAIDRSLPPRDERREDAGRRILAAEPMKVPGPEGLRRELEALRDRRR
ncbi:MAG: antitoxin [Actinomycetota bacterium]|nr:antitoxin [Actinomycetota bacterium]